MPISRLSEFPQRQFGGFANPRLIGDRVLGDELTNPVIGAENSDRLDFQSLAIPDPRLWARRRMEFTPQIRQRRQYPDGSETISELPERAAMPTLGASPPPRSLWCFLR